MKELRSERNMTLHQVAMKTDIDVTLISKFERGIRIPTEEQILKLSNFFNIPIEIFQAKSIADKIIKEYGLNDITIDALQILNEKLLSYKNIK